jgi:hypothetical protein
MGLSRGDFGVLAICLVAVIFSSQQEGDFAMVSTWYHSIDDSGHTYKNGHAPDPSERVYVYHTIATLYGIIFLYYHTQHQLMIIS